MKKNGNTLVENSLYNVVYKIISTVFPLIMASYSSHILLSEGIGKVASAQNKVQYFVLIASLGIPEYGIREIAKNKENNIEKNKLFTELFSLNLASSLMMGIVYFVIIYINNYFGERALYIVVGGTILLNILNVDWLYQGEENYRYITLRSLYVKCVSLIFLLCMIKTKEDYIKYALLNTIAIAGNNIYNVINLKRINIKLNFKSINIKKHLKPVLILLCTTVSIELYTLLDTTMVSYFCNERNVGYYTMALKIPRMIIVAVTGISGVLLPRLSRYYNDNKREECDVIISIMVNILFFLFLPTGLGLIIIAPECVEVLFGNSFLPGIITLRISALLIYSLGFSNLFGTQLLLIAEQEKKLLTCTLLGAGINIALNNVLIRLFEHNGAAMASVLSETVVTIVAIAFSRRYFHYGMNRVVLIDSVISAAIMAIVGLVVRNCISIVTENNILILIGTVFSGCIAYIAINCLIKNPIIKYIKELKKAT